MQHSLVLRTLGVLLMLFGGALVPPLAVSVLYDDGETVHFAVTTIAAFAAGLALWAPFRRAREQLRTRDGFVVVAMLWIALSALGSLPFVLGLELGFADALFESASGFTTTGATVIVGLDTLPPSILFYRQELQWLGGIGVVVSAIALLPMLGVGGMQLFKAETPGPIKHEKLTPRLTDTARVLWRLYFGLTAACALLYWLAGMSAFDAIAHSFSTLSTGGFSTHDASIAHFESAAIEAIAIVFMIVGSISFGVHFVVWRDLDLGRYRHDVQTRFFLGSVVAAVIVTAAVLWLSGERADPLEAVRYAAFEVVSVHTSTGYGIDDFSTWPLPLPVLLIFVSFVGGCAGSTAGGMKTIRFAILSDQASLQIRKLVHPSSVNTLKLEGRVVPPDVTDAVWAFFTIYVATFAVIMLVVMSLGLDQVSAFGAVATCLNNLGPGLGDVATDFVGVSDAAKLVFSFAMVLGRLEIFTILVLLSPDFWRG